MEFKDASDAYIRSSILYYNGFLEFQPIGEEHVLVGWCDDVDEDILYIMELSSTTTLEYNTWIGRGFIKINRSEIGKIPDVLNALLASGYSFTTGTRSKVKFDVNVDGVYSPEIMEQKIINNIRESFDFDHIHDSYDDSYFEIWNYTTPEGEAFCTELYEKFQKGCDTYDNPNNYFEWSIFKGLTV